MRAFVLNLPETPERTERMRLHLRERGVDFSFFNGIHAEKAGLRTVHPYDVDNPGSGYVMQAKSVGNVLSHYMLWAALSLLHDDYYLILEDDAEFPTDWHARMVKVLQDVPKDFDLLYVGSCCCEGKPKTLIAGEVWDLKYPACTHAYIVAKKALSMLLQTQRKVYAPVDLSMGFHSLPLLKCYTVLPRIVSQFDTVIAP